MRDSFQVAQATFSLRNHCPGHWPVPDITQSGTAALERVEAHSSYFRSLQNPATDFRNGPFPRQLPSDEFLRHEPFLFSGLCPWSAQMATACCAQEILDFILVLPQREPVFPTQSCPSTVLSGSLLLSQTLTSNHLI